MSLVKTDVPMTSRLCQQTVDLLLERYPMLKGRVLTTTAWNRPVYALKMGTGSRRLLFSAAHHANEWITATVLLKFAQELLAAAEAETGLGGKAAAEILKENTLYLVPMVDPDGVDLVTGALPPEGAQYESAARMARDYPKIPFPGGWKANGLGVDLNLQYPAGWLQAREIKFSQGYTRPGPRDYVGRAPLDQQESRALAEYTLELEPDLTVALHTQGEVIYWQFREYEIPGAKALAEAFARVSGYALAETPYESAFAGYKDWFIQRLRRPGFTVEAGRGENPLPPEQFDSLYGPCRAILLEAASPEQA